MINEIKKLYFEKKKTISEIVEYFRKQEAEVSRSEILRVLND